MSLREAQFLARLRRYARALAGPPGARAGTATPPDELVRETLERAAQALQHLGEDRESRIALFSLMHRIYAEREAAGTASERGHDFERAMSVLPTEQREVFLLVTVEEMSYEAVAAALGIPIGTVMSRLARAREKLRTLLRKPETRLRLAASNGDGQDR